MLLNNLEKMGISVDNTNFVILSDHGDQFMEHKEWGHGRLYEEVIRVPMIFCGPQIPKNTVIKEQVSLLDVAPTIFDIFKISTPSTFQGVSLLPLIDGKKIESDKHYVISEELGPDFSCRTEKWKYIRHDWTKTHELFRLEADPKEKKNVVSEFPDKVKELDAIISEHISMESNIAKTEEQECREFCEKNQKFMEEYARAHRKNPAFLNRISGSPRT
jgi:choline-sulfatase